MHNNLSVLASLQNPNSIYQLIIGSIIFETIASLLYGYIYDHVFPRPIILVCIMIVLLGITTGIRVVIAAKKQ